MLGVRVVQSDEYHCLHPLFRDVFGTEITTEMLSWKYADGRGRSYGVFDARQKLQTHCGLLYRQVIAEGHLRRIGQLVDLMARPGQKKGIARATSPFSRLISRVLADLEDSANPDALAFGFPSNRAMRLGQHLGLFASIDRMYQLTFSLRAPRRYADRIDHIKAFDKDIYRSIERLWRQMSEGLGQGLVGVRDATYLQHRYVNHPHYHYDFGFVRPWWGGRPLGLVVLRTDNQPHELMDILASPVHIERIVAAVRCHIGVYSVNNFILWLSENHAQAFVDHAQTIEPLEIRIMANPLSSGGAPQRFAGRWWLTSGDTDYR